MAPIQQAPQRARFSRCALALAAVVALAACGGGAEPEDPSTTTGLVPEALPLGATMEAQAATLQPLAPGATWTYTGQYFDAPGLGTNYTNVVTHVSAPTGVTETATNAFAFGLSEQPLSLAGGNLVQTGSVDLDGDGDVDIVDPILLRSPVRQNDQIVLFDLRQPMAIDPDGDGRNDSIDLAIYSQVVGSEPVALGGSLGSVNAVRLDVITKVRFVLTTRGAQPTYTTTLSSWYAPSIGIVRRRLEPDALAGRFAPYAEEVLVSVSGI